MDVSLLTLLRREDVSALRFADARAGALWVMPAKTAESTGVRLQIAMSDDLAALLARCRDAVVSPYGVHRLPDNARPSAKRAKGRAHPPRPTPHPIPGA